MMDIQKKIKERQNLYACSESSKNIKGGERERENNTYICMHIMDIQKISHNVKD